jgi:ligand-binding SRPBCC domain-containing protein
MFAVSRGASGSGAGGRAQPFSRARWPQLRVFVSSVVVQAPVETVFGFHEREDALRLLSPPFPPMRVIRKTGGIGPGSVVELKIGPIHWTALHMACEKNRYFVDEQTRGPFAEWFHVHEFESLGVATRLTDLVEYRLRGGKWINRLFGWIVQIALRPMFRHRHRMTRLYCENSNHESGHI